jgi:hypothetical protein
MHYYRLAPNTIETTKVPHIEKCTTIDWPLTQLKLTKVTHIETSMQMNSFAATTGIQVQNKKMKDNNFDVKLGVVFCLCALESHNVKR